MAQVLFRVGVERVVLVLPSAIHRYVPFHNNCTHLNQTLSPTCMQWVQVLACPSYACSAHIARRGTACASSSSHCFFVYADLVAVMTRDVSMRGFPKFC